MCSYVIISVYFYFFKVMMVWIKFGTVANVDVGVELWFPVCWCIFTVLPSKIQLVLAQSCWDPVTSQSAVYVTKTAFSLLSVCFFLSLINVLLTVQEKEHKILRVRILTPPAFRLLWGNKLNFDLLCLSHLPWWGQEVQHMVDLYQVSTGILFPWTQTWMWLHSMQQQKHKHNR